TPDPVALDVPLLGRIPFDPRLAEAGDRGTPYVLEHSASPAGQALLQMGEQVRTFLELAQAEPARSPASWNLSVLSVTNPCSLNKRVVWMTMARCPRPFVVPVASGASRSSLTPRRPRWCARWVSRLAAVQCPPSPWRCFRRIWCIRLRVTQTLPMPQALPVPSPPWSRTPLTIRQATCAGRWKPSSVWNAPRALCAPWCAGALKHVPVRRAIRKSLPRSWMRRAHVWGCRHGGSA